MPILVMKPIVSFTKDSACQCSHLPVSPFQLHGASTVRLPCGRALRIEYKAQQSRAALVPLPSDSSLCVVRTFNTAYFELRSPISAAQSRWADNPAKRPFEHFIHHSKSATYSKLKIVEKFDFPSLYQYII